MCWYHVKDNVENQAKRIKDSGLRYQFLADFETLSMSINPEIFEKVQNLFFVKWYILSNEYKIADKDGKLKSSTVLKEIVDHVYEVIKL